jgi:hypothetical protein
MLATILSFLTSGGLKAITQSLTEAYELRLRAQTDKEKLEADMVIRQLEARQAVLLAEQGRWYTAWIRPMLALPVVILVWKLLVYDTALGLGVTPDPGVFVTGIVWTIIGAYFLTRPFERK